MERHSSVGSAARVEMTAGQKFLLAGVVVALLEKQGKNHGVVSTTRVVGKSNRMEMRRIRARCSGINGGGEEEDGESRYPSHITRLGRSHRRSAVLQRWSAGGGLERERESTSALCCVNAKEIFIFIF